MGISCSNHHYVWSLQPTIVILFSIFTTQPRGIISLLLTLIFYYFDCLSFTYSGQVIRSGQVRSHPGQITSVLKNVTTMTNNNQQTCEVRKTDIFSQPSTYTAGRDARHYWVTKSDRELVRAVIYVDVMYYIFFKFKYSIPRSI